MVRVAALTVIAYLIALPLAAQNLLVNPGFDDVDQISGWTCLTTHGPVTWSTEDLLGSSTSGSMQHDVSAVSANQKITCFQCIPVVELHAYVAANWFYWPDDPDVDQVGSSRISYEYFSDAACTIFLGNGDIEASTPSALDTWLFHQTAETSAPPTTLSAMVYLFTWQNFAGQPVRARIDDVDFHTTTIFRDGFESGGTGPWEP